MLTKLFSQCFRCKKRCVVENAQRTHFFDNPDRYDADTEEITGSLQRSR